LTLNSGKDVRYSKPGTFGKVCVLPCDDEWEGCIYSEKEITVYCKIKADELILLTVIVRYGKGFLEK